MKAFKSTVIAMAVLLPAFANAHATRTISSELHKPSLKAGDRVVIYAKKCQGPKVQLCHKEKVGTGVVSNSGNIETLHQDAVADSDIRVKQGFVIEKE